MGLGRGGPVELLGPSREDKSMNLGSRVHTGDTMSILYGVAKGCRLQMAGEGGVGEKITIKSSPRTLSMPCPDRKSGGEG